MSKNTQREKKKSSSVEILSDSDSVVRLSSSASSASSVAASSSVLALSSFSSASEVSDGPCFMEIQLPLPRAEVFEDRDPALTARTHFERDQEWYGLNWGTRASGITNTCILDSFLSHTIYMERKFPGYFRRNLNLADSEAESSLLRITQVASHPDNCQTKFDLSRSIHSDWIQSTNPDASPDGNGVIDLKGDEQADIFAQLRESSLILFVHSCKCESETIVDDKQEHGQWTSAKIKSLSKRKSKLLATDEKLTKKELKHCKQCKSDFKFTSGLVPATTLLHNFKVSDDETQDQFPYSLQLQDAETGEPVHLDVGYFSYSTRPTSGASAHTQLLHHVSLHRFGNKLRWYDSMQKNGELQDIPADLKTKYKLLSVTYFRRFD